MKHMRASDATTIRFGCSLNCFIFYGPSKVPVLRLLSGVYFSTRRVCPEIFHQNIIEQSEFSSQDASIKMKHFTNYFSNIDILLYTNYQLPIPSRSRSRIHYMKLTITAPLLWPQVILVSLHLFLIFILMIRLPQSKSKSKQNRPSDVFPFIMSSCIKVSLYTKNYGT